jgi:hypothetical protein
MREISDETYIPLKTLYTWRDRVKEDPTWRLSPLRFQVNPRIMDDDIETMIAQYLRDNFVSRESPLYSHIETEAVHVGPILCRIWQSPRISSGFLVFYNVHAKISQEKWFEFSTRSAKPSTKSR